MRKVAYIIPAFFLLWGAGFSFASASVVFNSATSTQGQTSGSDISNGVSQCFAVRINAAQTGTINQIKVFLYQHYAGTQTIHLGLWNDAGTLLATSSLDVPYTDPEQYQTFSIPNTSLTASSRYWVGIGPGAIHTGSIGANNIGYPIDVPAGWNSSGQYYVNGTDCFNATPSGGDGGQTWTAWPVHIETAVLPTNSISITYPAANATTTPDHFIVQYGTTASSTGNPYEIVVETYPAGGVPLNAGYVFLNGNISGTATTSITAGQPYSPNTTYYEQAFLYYWYDANTFTTLASSTLQSFNTATSSYTPGAITGYYVPPPTSTISTSTPSIQITCDPNDGFFQYSLCYLFQAVFIPSPESLQHLTDVKTLVVSKPPMGWFNEIVASIQGINTSSTPAFVLITATTITAFSGLFYLIDVGLGVIFIFLAIMWTYHRARKMKL